MIDTHRKVSTVVAAKVLGYSRLMGIDEKAAVAGLKRLHDVFTKLVIEYGGSEFGSVGDSLMADFPSAVNALYFAVEMQHRVTDENSDIAVDRRLAIRVGLNLGDVMVEDGALFGDGVNVASRLQALAPPGGIVISGPVFDQVDGKVEASFRYDGEQAVKNVTHPVRTYLVADAGASRSLGQAISELVRRRIFRSAAAYVIVAWVMIQVADVVLPVFNAPTIFMRSLVILAIVGFPLAMVLAWSFNLGRRGLVATPNVVSGRRGGRWLPYVVVGIATSISAIVLWTVWNGYLANPDDERRSVRRAPPRIEQPVIAVVPFEKTFGGEDIDWLGDGLANLVRHSLADSRQTVVYSASASRAFAADLADSGVDYLITGNYLATAAGLVLSVEIDPTSDHVIVTETIEADNPEQLFERVDDLTRRLYQRLKLPSQKQVGQYSADFASSNVSAYELFVGGLEHLHQFDY
ncbi:MAG: adenylate/guanylate cyclase domain-containing protein, partial [Woeseiaceae bacterium]